MPAATSAAPAATTAAPAALALTAVPAALTAVPASQDSKEQLMEATLVEEELGPERA